MSKTKDIYEFQAPETGRLYAGPGTVMISQQADTLVVAIPSQNLYLEALTGISGNNHREGHAPLPHGVVAIFGDESLRRQWHILIGVLAVVEHAEVRGTSRSMRQIVPEFPDGEMAAVRISMEGDEFRHDAISIGSGGGLIDPEALIAEFDRRAKEMAA